jgi:hypothetical protein
MIWIFVRRDYGAQADARDIEARIIRDAERSGRGLQPAQAAPHDRCHSAVRTETKIREGGIGFSRSLQAQAVGQVERSCKLEFKRFCTDREALADGGLLLAADLKGKNRRFPHAQIFSLNTKFRKYQDHRKAMKMATSNKTKARTNQVAGSTSPKISRHGGVRAGAGRKPGSGNKKSFPLTPIADALVKAVAGKPAFLFVMAMKALEAPLDDVREALGLSRDQFMQEYGAFLAGAAELAEQGSLSYFAGKRGRSPKALRT